VYSLRAKERPTASTPVEWDEVEACHEAEDANLLVFDSTQLIERVERHGDLFAPVLGGGQRLAPALVRLRELTTDAAPPRRRPRRRN
jgi:bifunctional non-homologous end joining protein LigD